MNFGRTAFDLDFFKARATFFFLGLYPQHMEVPRLGIELELQPPAYATATATAMPDPSHSATYTAAHGNARSLIHWARPGIQPVPS